MSNTIHQFGNGDNIAGDNIAGDKIQGDKIQGDKILQLISNLRQTAAQFPPEIRDDMIIEIDDVEAEIQKPEQERSKPKLKKRLAALLTAATVTAAPIAGMTDFANNVMEIGEKLNIELPLLK